MPAPSGMIGPCADKLYAVLPAGVDTRIPSHNSSSIRTVPSMVILNLAVCEVSRSKETSLKARASLTIPVEVSTCILKGCSVTNVAASIRLRRLSDENSFIKNPTVPLFIPKTLTGLSM